MGRKRLTVPQYALAGIIRNIQPIIRNTRPNIQPLLSSLSLPVLQHPALSHPAEPDFIHHSLDLSFQQAIAVSNLDRQLIDDLTHTRCTHFQLS